MTLLRLTPAIATHRGMRRRHNEDSVDYEYPTDLNKLQTYGALFVVADGVGGLSAGDQASQMAVKKLIQHYYAGNPDSSVEANLASAFHLSNTDVFNALKREAATTLIAVVIKEKQVVAASIGDSLIYRIRDGKIEQLNEEDVIHSDDEQNGALTKAIGYREELELETMSSIVQSGDRFLLCSDGVTRYLDPEQLLRLSDLHDPRDSVRQMINRANAAGGADNITALMLLVGEAISDDELAKHQQKISVRVAVDTNPMMKLDVATKPHTQIPLSRPETVIPEDLLSTPEVAARIVPKPAPVSLSTETAKSINCLMIVGIAVIVLGAIIIGGGLVLLGNQDSNSSTELPSDSTETITLDEPATAETVGNLGIIEIGDTIILSSSILTLARVDNEDVAAFVAAPRTAYLIDEIFQDNEGQLWYRLLDQENEQSGWVSESNLPDYQLQRDS
jgi:serine/threonine protein phosphatase PrpC